MYPKEKINISFLNLAAQSPSLELNLAFSEKIHIENKKNKHLFFMCDAALKSCSVNVFNKKSICNICKFKAEKGFNEFKKRNKNSDLIKVNRSDLFSLNINHDEFDVNVQKELLLGVHSTIGSQLRLDDMSLLDGRWRKVKDRMLDSSYALFTYFNHFLSKNNVNNFIIFNGRLSCARPLIESSKKNKVNYNLFDAGVNGKVPMYSTNEMFHSIEFEQRNSFITYLKYFRESRNLAAKYFSYKRKKIPINDVAYTKNQIDNHIDDSVRNLSKPIISVFVSSDDEYRFIGSDWSKYKILDQIESIKELISSKLSDKFDFVIKMHPNQKSIHKSTMNKYKILSNDVTVLFPENFTDSYALIEYSELVINFCSSIAVEANYLRKPVVQIGPSKFIKFSIANFVESTKDAIELILNNKYKVMPVRGSIISFTYYMKSSFALPAYKFIEDGVYSYGDVFLKTPLYMRLIAVPAKLFVHIVKGDREILSNFSLYFKNLIFGITKVK